MDDWPVPRGAEARSRCARCDRAGYDRTVQYECLRRGARGEPLFWSGAEAFYRMRRSGGCSRRALDRAAARA